MLAAAAGMAFSYKLGCLPENVLQTLLNDRLVAKGSVLGFVTTFFQVGMHAEPLGVFVNTFHLLIASTSVSGLLQTGNRTDMRL